MLDDRIDGAHPIAHADRVVSAEARGPAAPSDRASAAGPTPLVPSPDPEPQPAPGAAEGARARAWGETLALDASDVEIEGSQGVASIAVSTLLANDTGHGGRIEVIDNAARGSARLSDDGTHVLYAFDLADFTGRDAFSYRIHGADGSRDIARTYFSFALDEGAAPEPRPEPEPEGAGETVVAINLGSQQAFTAADGTVFAADETGVGHASRIKAAIAATDDDALYRTGAWHEEGLSYGFALDPGSYRVALHFAETWSGAFADGVRVFDVAIEGEVVVDDLDVHAAVGARRALVVEREVSVGDGVLDLDLLPGVQNPAIAAIAITRLETGTAPHDALAARADALVFDWTRDVWVDQATGVGRVSFSASDLLANDAGGEDLQMAIERGPEDAAMRVAGEGTEIDLLIDPARFDGRTSFTYRAHDGEGMSEPATVTVEIEGIPAPSPTPARLTLVDAGADRVLFALGPHTVLEADSIEGRSLSVMAEPAVAGVRSARMLLDGAQVRVENVEPYALFGDASGDFEGGLAVTGWPGVEVGVELHGGRGGAGALLGRAEAHLTTATGTIWGRDGAPDVFAFDEARMGADRLHGFEGFDRLAFFGDGGRGGGDGLDAGAILALARIEGRDTVIDFGDGDVLTLVGFTGLTEDHILI